MPQRVFNHGKTPPGLVNWCGSFRSELIGVPDLRDQLCDASLRSLSAHVGQCRTVECTEAFAQGAMLVDQGPSGNFCGVGREDQINMERFDCLLYLLVLRLGLQDPQRFLQGRTG